MAGTLAKIAGKIADVGKDILKGLIGSGQKIPKGHQSTEPIDYAAIDSSTKVLGLIYMTMQRARTEELAQRKEDEKGHKDKLDDENKRNEELIKALTIRRKPKKKKKEEPKEEPKKEEKKKPPPKKEPVPKAEQVPKKEAPPKVEVKKTPEKVPTKQAPSPKAEPTAPSAPAAKPPPSAGKIAIGAAVGAAGVFASAEAFAKTMMPQAERASQALGGKIPPVAILGQWAGESSNGKSVSAPFNYAGIKAGKNDKKGDYVLTEERYTDAQIKQAQASGETLNKVLGPNDTITKKGRQVTVDEWYGKGSIAKAQAEGKQWVQVKSYFAKFDSPEEFTDRYVQFLSAPRYAKARESTTPAQFGLEVAKAGYATASADKYSAGIADYASKYPSLSSASPTSTPTSGTKIDQASKENKEMKDAAANAKKQQTVNNVGVNQTNTQKASVSEDPDYDDRNAYQKKKG